MPIVPASVVAIVNFDAVDISDLCGRRINLEGMSGNNGYGKEILLEGAPSKSSRST